MNNRIIFKYVSEHKNVEIEFNADSTQEEMCENFESFLKAIGFVFGDKEHVVVADDETD